tara:strand:+ start:240 stop:542 length:303 start_codon:yes stop_codon:yes gene_type:complete
MPSPLYETDKEIADRLASKELDDLTNDDITNASRLLIRYSGVPNSEALRNSIIMALHKWDKTSDDLHEKSKSIWQSGWRPGRLEEEEIGSGADVSAGCGQ